MSKAAARTPHFGRTEELSSQQLARSDQPVVKAESRPIVNAHRPPGRVGKKVISGFFDPHVSKQLARLAVDQERSIENLLGEALNDLFTKYQLPPIA